MVPFWNQSKKIQPRHDKDKAARREAACRPDKKEDAVSSIASTTQHSSAEGSIEVTVSSRKDATIGSERATEEKARTPLSADEESTAELYRFGMAFGWAKGVAPLKSPRRCHVVSDVSETAQQHYAALQAWKGQHAAFLQRPPNPEKDRDAADAQEWQQALDYAFRREVLRLAASDPPVGEACLGLGNRVVMAPHGMMPRNGAKKNHHRVLYVVPAGLDFHVPVPHGHPHAKTALCDWYTTALALYLYRTLVVLNSNVDDDGDPDVTIVLDVRSGGPAWPNPGVLTLLPFIRHVSRVLPRVLPHRVSQVLVGPLPGWACQLHHWAVAPLLPAMLRLTLLAGPSTAATALLPSALAQHLRGDDDDPVARLEALRRTAIRERRNGS